jgi:hypothetical protein
MDQLIMRASGRRLERMTLLNIMKIPGERHASHSYEKGTSHFYEEGTTAVAPRYVEGD